MRFLPCALVALLPSLFIATTASAACEGGLGRGWSTGDGAGKFEMASADKVCQINYPKVAPGVLKIVAKDTKLTTAPKSGKISLNEVGPVYTPNAGFKGSDKFCMRSNSAGHGRMSGCVTVTVK